MPDRKPLPALTRYRNRSGHSGVRAYTLLGDGIVVEFHTGALYLYGHRRPGAATVTRMKSLARGGRGLSTFISQHVAGEYEARFVDGAWLGIP